MKKVLVFLPQIIGAVLVDAFITGAVWLGGHGFSAAFVTAGIIGAVAVAVPTIVTAINKSMAIVDWRGDAGEAWLQFADDTKCRRCRHLEAITKDRDELRLALSELKTP